MLDLDETAWDRGVADAKRWRGQARWIFAAGGLTALAVGIAWWRGLAGPAVGLIGLGTGLVLFAAQIVYGIVSAPVRQRNEARAAYRELQGNERRFPTLREFHSRGVRLSQERFDKSDEAAYRHWRARAVSWTQNVESCLSVDYGPGEVELFERPDWDDKAGRLPYAVNQEHDGALKLLDARLRLIQTILDRPD